MSMPIVKYLTLFLWSLLLLAATLTVVKWHPFIRRKKEKEMNTSEGIYVVALLLSAALLMTPLVQSISMTFDVLQKLAPQRFWLSMLERSSVLSVIGLLMYLLVIVSARWLSPLLAGNRNPLVELDADHRGYALLRGGLLLALAIVAAGSSTIVFNYLIPSVEVPYYR